VRGEPEEELVHFSLEEGEVVQFAIPAFLLGAGDSACHQIESHAVFLRVCGGIGCEEVTVAAPDFEDKLVSFGKVLRERIAKRCLSDPGASEMSRIVAHRLRRKARTIPALQMEKLLRGRDQRSCKVALD